MRLLFLLILVIFHFSIFAQDNKDNAFICHDLALSDKPKITIENIQSTSTDRRVSVPTENIRVKISSDLAATNCYRIIETQKVGYGRKPSEEVREGLNAVVKGIVTKYDITEGGFSTIKNIKVSMTLSIQIVTDRNGEVLSSQEFSESVNQQWYAGKVGAGSKKEATENALEKLLDKIAPLIVEFVANERHKFPDVSEFKETKIESTGGNAMKFLTLCKFLENLECTENLVKNFDAQKSSIVLIHSCTQDELLEKIFDQSGLHLDIKGFDDASIQLYIKS